MVVAKEFLFLLVLLTASGTWGGRGCSADGDLTVVCNGSGCLRVTSGGAMLIDEVVSEAKDVLHCHPFSICKVGTGLGRETRQPHCPKKINGVGVAVAIER